MTTQMEHVEGSIALSSEVAPVGNGTQFGKACHAGKKMILQCAYGPFNRVSAMDVRWSVQDANFLHGNKHFDVFGCFVVKFVQKRFEAVECEPGIDLVICTKKLFF